MDDIVIDLTGAAELELETADIGVADDTVSFTLTGMIRGVDDAVLSDLEGTQLTPTEIHFTEATG
jgi:hypothetical protein